MRVRVLRMDNTLDDHQVAVFVVRAGWRIEDQDWANAASYCRRQDEVRAIAFLFHPAP